MALTTAPQPPPGPHPGARPNTTIDATAVEDREPGTLDRWSDPVVLLVAAAVLALVALIPSAIRAPITLPLALFLPGHALLAALDRPDRHLSGGARVALRVVLSMATLSLGVLAVGTAIGVTKLSVIGTTWALSSLFALASWNRDLPDRTTSASAGWTQSGVLLTLGGLVSVALVVVALLLLPEPRHEPYSSLSLAGTSKSSASPIVVRSGRTAQVTVRLENHTGKSVRYGVIPAIDGGAAWSAKKVRLGPGESWSGTVKGRIPAGACLTRLTVALSANAKASGVDPLVLYVRNEAGAACR